MTNFNPQEAERLAKHLERTVIMEVRDEPSTLKAAAMLRAAVKEVRFMHDDGFAQSKEIDRLQEQVRELTDTVVRLYDDLKRAEAARDQAEAAMETMERSRD